MAQHDSTPSTIQTSLVAYVHHAVVFSGSIIPRHFWLQERAKTSRLWLYLCFVSGMMD